MPANPVPSRVNKHWPQLDGLRGVAVLLVFACHAEHYFAYVTPSNWILKGWIGVDLFFVLSGFLITGILINAKGSANYFSAFYARRSLRIWPLYFLLILLVFAVLPFANSYFATMVKSAGPVWFYVLFLQNVFPYPRPAPLAATWSLAVEEQFYVCWSVLVAAMNEEALRVLMWALLIAAPLVRFIALGHGVSAAYIYFNLFHLDGLALGSICALAVRSAKPTRSLARGFTCCGLVLCAIAGVPNQIENTSHPLTFSAVALVCAGVLLFALENSMLSDALKSRPLIFFGNISYCLYLVHVPMLSFVDHALRSRHLAVVSTSALTVTIAFVAAVGVATISLYALENRVLRLKRHCEYRRVPSGESALTRVASGQA